MTLMTRNLWLVLMTFLLSLAILYMVVFHLDPFGGQALQAYLLLFFAGFLVCASFFTMFLFFFSELFSGHKLGERKFFRAVRRSLLISIFIMVCFFLQLFRLLGLLEVVLLIIVLSIFEYLFYFIYHW